MLSAIGKYGVVDDITKFLCKNNKIKRAISSDIKRQVLQFEKSEDNLIRSLCLLYDGGVIGRDNYEDVRSALTNKQKHWKDHEEGV